MPAAYVKPYVKTHKNDVIDAEAICEAVQRPTMRFVPVKSETQQAVLTLHRTRTMLTRQRVMISNAMRAFLLEFGIVLPIGKLGTSEVLKLAEGSSSGRLPELARAALLLFAEQYRLMMKQIKNLERLIGRWNQENRDSRRLSTIPGIGPITATALIATIGDVSKFKSGRQMAAWMGFVPQQHSSGGKTILGHISRRGNAYLRGLFFLGAMAILRSKANHGLTRWARRLKRSKPYRVVVVALANKLVRVAWALLAHGEDFRATAAA